MDPDRIPTVERVPHGGQSNTDLIDFSANINPRIPWGVDFVFTGSLARSRQYPDEPPTDYRETAAQYVGCAPDQVIPTPGGLAAIRLAIACTVRPGDAVAIPVPSFGEYAREVRLHGADPRFINETELLESDPTDYALVIVCHPNNPTGLLYDRDDLLAFIDRCRTADTPVLLDEAFLGFTDRASFAGTRGVIIARSLTKLFGLPGLRAGFAVATDTLLESFQKARQPWNISTPAARVGAYCMAADGFVRETRCRIRTERAKLYHALAPTFDIAPSQAPFLLLDVGDGRVEEIIRSARTQGIVLRDARTFRGLSSHIRVAIRLSDENQRLVEVLADV